MIKVAAGIIKKNGKYLAARRGAGKHMAGKWEFPGGKIEPGETPEQCLIRELKEEFSIEVAVGEHVGNSVYDYGSKVICLMGYLVSHVQGAFSLQDHDQILWLTVDEMLNYDFAPADIPLIEALKAHS